MSSILRTLRKFLPLFAAGLFLILLLFILWGPNANPTAQALILDDLVIEAPTPIQGVITGVVIYSGTVTGTHLVWVGAFTDTNGPPASVVNMTGTGQYILAVYPGMYTILAGLDVDNSGGPPNLATDPMGEYVNNPLTITSGSLVTDINITLIDPVPPVTGTITGWITFTSQHVVPHQIIVYAQLEDASGPPQYGVLIPGPGPYTLTNVVSGTYHVGAFMDLDNNGSGPPLPDQPFGWYDPDDDGDKDIVVISSSAVISDINITLEDPLTYLSLPCVLKAQ